MATKRLGVNDGNIGGQALACLLPVKGMHPGQWYAARDNPGIFVSLIHPEAVAPAILQSCLNLVRPLGGVEAGALVYLVAFDLQRFNLGFALGTDHPRVDWSERILPQMEIPSLPGPDGIGTIAPLVANGMVSPVDAAWRDFFLCHEAGVAQAGAMKTLKLLWVVLLAVGISPPVAGGLSLKAPNEALPAHRHTICE